MQVGFDYHHATATITYIQPPLPQIYNYIAPPPATTTTQCKLDECKWSMCASGWKEKHHQRKLQLVMTTKCASGVLPPLPITCLYASCNHCCIRRSIGSRLVQIWSVVVVVVVVDVAASRSGQLALMLVLFSFHQLA